MTKTNLSDSIEKVIYQYGFVPILAANHFFEHHEKYEVCEAITAALNSVRETAKIDIPKTLEGFTEEDYKALFWQHGMAGETAFGNLPAYTIDAINSINNLTTKPTDDENNV